MKNYKVKQVSYYGYDHTAVQNQLEGDLTFCNEFCMGEGYYPWAVYKAKTPNKKKNHKKYVLLQTTEVMGMKKGVVTGMTAPKMAKERYQHAVMCKNCNTVLYSINRHHYHKCSCSNETMVDGGKQYLRYGGKDLKKIKVVTLDLITNKIKSK